MRRKQTGPRSCFGHVSKAFVCCLKARATYRSQQQRRHNSGLAQPQTRTLIQTRILVPAAQHQTSRPRLIRRRQPRCRRLRRPAGLHKHQPKINTLIQNDKSQNNRPPLQRQNLLHPSPLNPPLPPRHLVPSLHTHLPGLTIQRRILARARAAPESSRESTAGEFEQAVDDCDDEDDGGQGGEDDEPDEPGDEGGVAVGDADVS
jgi:hypothetical protein